MKNMVITGASGYLGSALVKRFSCKYKLIRLSHKSKVQGYLTIDLTDEEQVSKFAKNCNADYILHTAGKKAKFCEENPESSLVNFRSSQLITKYFPSSLIYYFSSDFVFDGFKGNFKETDTPNPSTIYGVTKLKGENSYDLKKHCIIRTSGLFDINEKGFVNYVISQLSQGKKVEAFTDICNTPTYLPYFCNYLEAMIKLNLAGLFHVCGSERVSRFEFAKLIAKTFGYDEDLITRRIAPKSFLNPRDSSLDSSKIRNLLNLEWKSLTYALEDMYNKSLNYGTEKLSYE